MKRLSLILASVLTAAVLVLAFFVMSGDTVSAAGGGRFAVYLDDFNGNVDLDGITDVNLRVVKVSSDGTVDSAIPGMSLGHIMSSASAFKAAHPGCRVNLSVKGVSGWESFVESSAYVSRVNAFSSALFELASGAGLDGIDLYIDGPTSVNFATLCKALGTLTSGSQTPSGDRYSLSIAVCHDGHSLELTNVSELRKYVSRFNVCCYGYDGPATSKLMSETVTDYLDYGLSAGSMIMVLSPDTDAGVIADITSVAYADGLEGIGMTDYSSPGAADRFAPALFVFSNGINIIVKGDVGSFTLNSLGEYDRDQIIVSRTVGSNIYPVVLSYYDRSDSTLNYIASADSGYYAPYYVQLAFTDLSGTPHCDDAQFCAARGLFDTAGDGTFRPGDPLTGGQLFAALCRICGDSDSINTAAGSEYYQPFVSWAVSKGLVKSSNALAKNPSSAVTSSQLEAVMRALAYSMGNEKYAAVFTVGSTVTRGEAASVFRAYIESCF